MVQPSVPDKPGKSAPYPTSDIRRAMNRPSCTAVQQAGSEEEEVILYGYFGTNRRTLTSFMVLKEWAKVRYHHLKEPRTTFLFEPVLKSVWTALLGGRDPSRRIGLTTGSCRDK